MEASKIGINIRLKVTMLERNQKLFLPDLSSRTFKTLRDSFSVCSRDGLTPTDVLHRLLLSLGLPSREMNAVLARPSDSEEQGGREKERVGQRSRRGTSIALVTPNSTHFPIRAFA